MIFRERNQKLHLWRGKKKQRRKEALDHCHGVHTSKKIQCNAVMIHDSLCTPYTSEIESIPKKQHTRNPNIWDREEQSLVKQIVPMTVRVVAESLLETTK
jgi:hypothetical protein